MLLLLVLLPWPSCDCLVFHKWCFCISCSGRLQDCELKVTCIPGNGAWRLNCSQETWEDGVEFSWISPVKYTDATLGSSVMELISQDLDLVAMCMAKNKASDAYRTVTLKEVCAGKFFSG